jgi:hypothetical protein
LLHNFRNKKSLEKKLQSLRALGQSLSCNLFPVGHTQEQGQRKFEDGKGGFLPDVSVRDQGKACFAGAR